MDMLAHGLMQEWALTSDRILRHAAIWHGAREVVSRTDHGEIERKTYAAARADAARLTNALIAAGVRPGDRIATLAMNGIRHLEAWYGVTGMGAICHTLDPRLFIDRLIYMINHARDRLILADGAFAPVLDALLPHCPLIERVVFLTGAGSRIQHRVPQDDIDGFSAGFDDVCAWGGFDERSAAGLCYTSGAAGDPKGVLYSHRSNYLHMLTTLQPDGFNIGVRDVVLAAFPMHQANCWGLACSAPAVGANLVLPGARLDGPSLYELIERERVTVAAGAPAVWQELLEHLEFTGQRTSSLERVFIGGAPCPERVIRELADLDIEPIQVWGMTELSPAVCIAAMTPELEKKSFEDQVAWRMKQGRVLIGVELELRDEAGQIVPHDGRFHGRLFVRGPSVASAYYNGQGVHLDDRGFFDTGAVATIDPEGFMQIVAPARPRLAGRFPLIERGGRQR